MNEEKKYVERGKIDVFLTGLMKAYNCKRLMDLTKVIDLDRKDIYFMNSCFTGPVPYDWLERICKKVNYPIERVLEMKSINELIAEKFNFNDRLFMVMNAELIKEFIRSTERTLDKFIDEEFDKRHQYDDDDWEDK